MTTRWSYSVRLLPITKTYVGTINTGTKGPRFEAFDTARDPLERVVRLATAAPELLEALEELVALVRGECPSLLNEDSGGSARLDLAIDAAIAKASGK